VIDLALSKRATSTPLSIAGMTGGFQVGLENPHSAGVIRASSFTSSLSKESKMLPRTAVFWFRVTGNSK
jgi:hypothetical protein